jgi:LmbE family N-acetylglucosaminyl deacetylase
MNSNVLIIAPHPDDFYISCAGLILESAEDYNFDVFCMTYKNIQPNSELRIREEKNAIKELSNYSGVQIKLDFFKEGEDTTLYRKQKEMVLAIEQKITKKKYDLILCPHKDDTHQDHREVSAATLSATRYQRNILFFETPSTINFQPSLFIEISDKNAEVKRGFSKNYESQILGHEENYRFTLSDFINAKLVSNGAKSRTCKYAEGYIPHRLFL